MAGACLEAPPGAGPADLCAPIDAGPRDPTLGNVIDYDFDDDDSLTEVVHDRSGNRLDGALEGATITGNGKYGLNARWVEGSQEALIEVPDDPLLHLGSEMTLEVWVWRDEIGVDHGLFATFDPELMVGELILEIVDDGLWFGVATGECDAPVMSSVVIAADRLMVGQDHWIHLAVTWDGKDARFYRNGSLAATEPFSPTPCRVERPLYIGGTGVGLLPFHGWLDDVKISSYVKSESEIKASLDHDPTLGGARCGNRRVEEGEDCESPAPCCDPATCLYAESDCGCQECEVGLCVGETGRVESDLIALYDFDEGEGSTVADSSGTGLDLTIAGAGFTWGPGTLSLAGDTLLGSNGTAEALVAACQASQEVTVEAWVTPGDLAAGRQTLFALGLGDDCQGFALTQQANRLTAALSTALTELDGEPYLDTPEASIEERLMHVVLTRSADGWRRLYLDGRVVGESLVAGDLSSWDVAQRITVGGPMVEVSPSCEKGEAGFWQGQLHRLAVYARALTPGEVAGNYGAGPETAASALR